MQHTITEHYIKYYPERLIFSSFADKIAVNGGMIIKVRLKG